MVLVMKLFMMMVKEVNSVIKLPTREVYFSFWSNFDSNEINCSDVVVVVVAAYLMQLFFELV